MNDFKESRSQYFLRNPFGDYTLPQSNEPFPLIVCVVIAAVALVALDAIHRYLYLL